MPPSIEESADEPIKYIGNSDTDKHYYDGRLRHVVGVHKPPGISCQSHKST